jgi:hypothetical protein
MEQYDHAWDSEEWLLQSMPDPGPVDDWGCMPDKIACESLEFPEVDEDMWQIQADTFNTDWTNLNNSKILHQVGTGRQYPVGPREPLPQACAAEVRPVITLGEAVGSYKQTKKSLVTKRKPPSKALQQLFAQFDKVQLDQAAACCEPVQKLWSRCSTCHAKRQL